MINFENLNGFVVDLTTTEQVLKELNNLDCNTIEVLSDCELDINGIRNFILDYYTNYYKYIFCKAVNVYQICDDELWGKNRNEEIGF